MTVTLPKPFAALEPFVADWALATQNERERKRLRSTRGELRAFYEAAQPLLGDILAYVDRYPLGEIPQAELPLYRMMLSLAEVAPHIELYGGDPKVPHSFAEERFIADHGAVAI